LPTPENHDFACPKAFGLPTPASISVDFEDVLNAAMNKLREALGDDPDSPRYVETLPRRGYRFVGAISQPSPPGIAENSTGKKVT
jgi:DNA-binding winged helix-turn-helix (wHTH) protein